MIHSGREGIDLFRSYRGGVTCFRRFVCAQADQLLADEVTLAHSHTRQAVRSGRGAHPALSIPVGAAIRILSRKALESIEQRQVLCLGGLLKRRDEAKPVTG